jgi:alkanesulfonate monooxygenase SsuD/methylene tetrahydromethanopterin reductase-like flavin-dependent oxidoreductase (luciferase family)
MSAGEVTYGYVVAPVPRGLPHEVTSDPTRAAQALMSANEKFIEALQPPFDTLWVEDHFQWDKRPVIEAITTLAYLAGRHEKFRFGHIVLGQSYRNPALTAKMAANLQMLTHGRFILGIGAGWKEDEYHAYGYPYPPASQRIGELEDTVQIIKALWTQSPATYHGKYYSIDNAECVPQPDPPVPLLIAGGGEQKTLRVVARYADWWNFNFCTADEYAHKLSVLKKHCEEIGRDPAEITLTYYGAISVVRDPAEVAKREFHVVGGTPDMVAEELQRFLDMGVRHVQVRFMDFPNLDGYEMFTKEVLPRLR